MMKKIITSRLYVQALILISPLIILFIWRCFFVEGSTTHSSYILIISICLYLVFYFLIFLWQFLMLTFFYREIKKKAKLLTINSIIPLLFLLYLLISLISSLISLEERTQEFVSNSEINRPIRIAEAPVFIYIYLLFIAHTVITFFINLISITASYNKTTDIQLKAVLKIKYIKPFKIITWSALALSFLFFVIQIIIDMIALM